MHKALQLAALAAGSFASPQGGNFRGGHGWNAPPSSFVNAHTQGAQGNYGQHGQGEASSYAAAAASSYSAAAASVASTSESTSTVYTSVPTLTITSCADAACSTSSSVSVAAVTASVSSVSSVVSSSISVVASSGSSAASGSVASIVSGSTVASASTTGSLGLAAKSSTSAAINTITPAFTEAPTTTTVVPDATSCSLVATSPISNHDQTGDSILGTLCEPYLPQWVGDYPSAPWGNLTVKNSDATVVGDIPITNVTRYYNWTISRGQISPDGVLRDVILINGQFPGPKIEANWGDNVEVQVFNNISNPFEGTSIHWHGVLQRGTPWMDGVPGTGQCPIAPGHSLTYNFIAELHGTSWYHAHFSAQFTAGIAGPVVVHGPSALPHDIDIGPVMLSDWYHIPYFSIVMDAVGKNYSLVPPVSDSVLINGRGQYDCSKPSYSNSSEWLGSNIKSNLSWTCVENAPRSAFRFQSGKAHRIRFINSGANGIQRISIDHHNMTVIATDYVPTMPYDTEVVTLGVGQRTDVIVVGSNTPKASIWMRTNVGGDEPCGASSNPETLAGIYYEDADIKKDPTSQSWATYNATDCVNDPITLTTPSYSITPSNNTWTQDIGLTLELNETGHFEFAINGQAAHMDVNVPLLDQVAQGNLTAAPEWNVYNFHKNTSIILNITNNMPLAHPWHLHGHNFYVLNVGTGNGPALATGPGPNGGPGFESGATWDGTVVKPENPMRRDTQIIPPYGFLAIQFELDNPGVWPFHCHIAWHLSGGQVMNVVYRNEDIVPLPYGWVADSCVNWDWYSAHNVVDQIDAGA